LHSVLYGVGVYDWPTMLVVLLVLAAAALIAAAVPTLRVLTISPAQVLRDE
jgi:ABC-type antimicrobial peptide transport system permease subunit